MISFSVEEEQNNCGPLFGCTGESTQVFCRVEAEPHMKAHQMNHDQDKIKCFLSLLRRFERNMELAFMGQIVV